MSSQSKMNTTNDEIDLIELVKALWDKKIWILISTFVFTLLAGIYAFTAKEQWTSKANVIAPKVNTIQEYVSFRRDYTRLIGGESVSANDLANSLYSRFNLLTNSIDEREAYLKDSPFYQKLVEGKTDLEKLNVLHKLSREAFSVIRPDPKKDPHALGITLAFSAETAAESQQVLEQYIDYLNQQVINEEVADFKVTLQEKISDLQNEKKLIEFNLKAQHKVQLENLRKAYEIAKTAGVQNFSSQSFAGEIVNQQGASSEALINLSDSKLADNSYLFLLGERYLKSQIDVIEKNSIVYPPRYYAVLEHLKTSEKLVGSLGNIEVKSYAYLASPEYPITKDKPKKALILLIGMIVGFVVSSMVILVVGLFRKEK